MNELERRLQQLGGEIAYPATPRFDLDLQRRAARPSLLRPLALGFAILVAVVAGVLAFSPGARSAFLEIFHIRGATVERVDELPDVRAQRLDFGEQVSREEAERRAEGRREGLALRAAHELPSGDAAPSPEGRALAAEQRAELVAALERLSEDDRLVLSCRYLLDLGEEETAAALGVRRGTVKSRTSRALARLRAEMEAAPHRPEEGADA